MPDFKFDNSPSYRVCSFPRCTERAQWDEHTSRGWRARCHYHFGLRLRVAGLRSLKITSETIVTATAAAE